MMGIKIKKRMIAVFLLVVLAFTLVMAGLPVYDAQAAPPIPAKIRDVFRVEKHVTDDGAAIMPGDENAANDHLYEYTLSVTADYTVTVKYLNDSYEPIAAEKEFIVPRGKTFSAGSGKPFSVLDAPPISELTNKQQYRNFVPKNSEISYDTSGSGRKMERFDETTPVLTNIEILYFYGVPESGNVNIESSFYVDKTQDSFFNKPESALQANARVYATLYRSTSSLGTGAEIVPGVQQQQLDVYTLSKTSASGTILFSNQPRTETGTGKPYYYQLRFHGENLPDHYRVDADCMWTTAMQSGDTIRLRSFNYAAFALQPIMHDLQVVLTEQGSGLALEQRFWPDGWGGYYYSTDNGNIYVDINYPLSVLHGQKITLQGPNYQLATSLDWRNAVVSPAIFNNDGLPVMQDLKAVFSVTSPDNLDTFDLEMFAYFDSFQNDALGADNNTDSLLKDKEIEFIVYQKLGENVEKYSYKTNINYGNAYISESLPRYTDEGGQRQYYQYRVEQVIKLDNNGVASYTLDGPSEWFQPLIEEDKTVVFQNTPIVKEIRIDFKEETLNGTSTLPKTAIPDSFLNLYQGQWKNGGYVISALMGGKVNVEPPVVYEKASESAAITNGGAPITDDLYTTFLYDLRAQPIQLGAEVKVSWGGLYSSSYDELGNYIQEGLAFQNVAVQAQLFRRLAGESDTGTAFGDPQNSTLFNNINDIVSMNFSGLERATADGTLYEYQVRLSVPSDKNLPTRNGVSAFKLSASNWVNANTAKNSDGDFKMEMEVVNPGVQYSLTVLHKDGEKQLEKTTLSVWAGAKNNLTPYGKPGYGNYIYPRFISNVQNIDDFNSVFETTFTSFDPSAIEIVVDKDMTISFSGLPATSSGRSQMEPGEQAAPAPTPEQVVPLPPTPEQVAPVPTPEQVVPMPTSEQKEIVPLVVGSEHYAQGDEDSLAAEPSMGGFKGLLRLVGPTTGKAANLNNVDYYDEDLDLHFIGNQYCQDFTKIDHGKYTFKMSNGGVLEAKYYGEDFVIPTLAAVNPGELPFEFTLTEIKQPYGDHQARLNSDLPKTAKGENHPLPLSFVTYGEISEVDDGGWVGNIGEHKARYITNLLPVAGLRVIKHEAGNESNRLEGVVFDLQRKENGVSLPVETGMRTDNNGEINRTNILPAGDYQLVEMSTISGYERLSTPVQFSVSNEQAQNKEIVIVTVPNEKTITPTPSPSPSPSVSPTPSPSPSASPKPSPSPSVSPKPSPSPTVSPWPTETPEPSPTTVVPETETPAPPKESFGGKDDYDEPKKSNVVKFGPLEIPRGSMQATGVWSLLNLMLSIMGLVISIILIIHQFVKRKKEGDSEEKLRWNTLRWMIVVVGILLAVLFLLLENTQLPIALLNSYTPIFLVIFGVDMVMLLVFALRKHMMAKEDDDSQADM